MERLVYDEIEGADLKVNGMLDDIVDRKKWKGSGDVGSALQYMSSDGVVGSCLILGIYVARCLKLCKCF